MKITRTWLEDHLNNDVLERGEACFLKGQVCEMEVLDQGSAISGAVGADDARYSVYVDMDECAVDGDCSCSVGYNCEHVAALLLACLSAQHGDQHISDGIHTAAQAKVNARQASQSIANPAQDQSESDDYPPDVHQRILYLLYPAQGGHRLYIDVVSARRMQDGSYGKPSPYLLRNFFHHILQRFVLPVDVEIIKLQHLHVSSMDRNTLIPVGIDGATAMKHILASGRCHWLDAQQPAIILGEERPGTWLWHVDETAHQHLFLQAEGGKTSDDFAPAKLIMPTSPPFYLSEDALHCGQIRTACPTDMYASIFTRSYRTARSQTQTHPQSPSFRESTFVWPTSVPACKPLDFQHVDVAPQAVLQLFSHPDNTYLNGFKLRFDYGGPLLRSAHYIDEVAYYKQADQWFVTNRDRQAERAFVRQLRGVGLRNTSAHRSTMGVDRDIIPEWTLPKKMDWQVFLACQLGDLRQAGFRIETQPGFGSDIVQVRQWDARCKDHGIMGEIHFEVVLDDGLHIDLIQIIASWIKAEPDRLSEKSLQQLAKLDVQYLPLPDGRMLPIAADMLHGMVVAMLDVFTTMVNKQGSYDGVDTCNTTAMQWLALRDVLYEYEQDTTVAMHVEDDAAWRDRMRQLSNMRDIPDVSPPAGLSVQLRAYQQLGLNWLQNLRGMHVGALLADDMGLGKTIQTLAHILKEKEAGRLSHPVLVVAPTSLMHNWKAEAARFSPDLKVLLLHGAKRKEQFSSITDHDLVLTTYGLLGRDSHALQHQHWAMLVLDEAQNIRNPRTAAARAVRKLQADQRICLTGTPMENHLGELWALFDFLMPGYLGDARTFSRCFRKPIEQEADSQRQDLLNLRIRPFMLRRSKDVVATDLPPKTNIVRTVEMGDAQRQLYEGVRLLMHQQVRDAMQHAGKGESTMMVLNALLKMRQVCCDPRLLKFGLLNQNALKLQSLSQSEENQEPVAVDQEVGDQALGDQEKTDQEKLDDNNQTTTPSAITLESIDKAGSGKLDWLRDMLPEMIAEGRRILLFSQFTRMLNLIAELCDDLSIPYVMLTGSTRNRSRPIQAFQNHDVPLFLISLKAGGVGLNLTAADSVIHYDPWWNPAAEAQASDRAHRIGQDKPVFVYKLITGGSVESRILDMQVRKQKLADAVYQGSKKMESLWSDMELESLFAPLEDK